MTRLRAIAALVALLLAACMEMLPTKPDAVSAGILIFAVDEECDLERWSSALPTLTERFDIMGADHGLWAEGDVLPLFTGTALVLRKEPWVDRWGRKVAGLAVYRRGIETLCLEPHRSALAREWFLMITCDMGGDEDYESCITPEAREFFAEFNRMVEGTW